MTHLPRLAALFALTGMAFAYGCGSAGGAPPSTATTGGEATTSTTATSSVTSTSTTTSGGGGTGGMGGGGMGGAPPLDAGPACTPDVPRTVALQAWAEPAAGQAPFVDALSTAQISIRVMVYEMGFGAILDTLKQKALDGIYVRVILDVSKQDINQKYYDQLIGVGAEVAWGDPQFTYMHAKTLVIDDAIAVISTGNYLASQMAKERNYVVRDEDPADVASLVTLFDADWERKTPDLSCTRLLISPVNARERLIDLINSASATMEIESMQLADSGIRAAILGRQNAGVSIRVILADTTWVDSNASAVSFLQDNGIPVKYLLMPKVHVKALAVDGERAYLGSENFSFTSLSKNREVGVIAFEPAVLALMSTTFEGDWAVATPF
ncbi:MAG: phospholipase D-like domain-containing protein [Minicystis sp.]